MAKQGASSVFRKLFLLFLGLVIVIFTVLVNFFITYVKQQREIEMSSQVNRVTTSASVIEQQLNAIFNVETQLLNDVRVAQLAHRTYENDYAKSQLILDLLASIQRTQSINSMIEDIVILFPEEGIELSAANLYHKRSYDTSAFQIDNSTASNQLVLIDNQVEMHVSYPLMHSVEENYVPDYEIRIRLSGSYLDNFLENFRNQNLEGAFWVLNEDSEDKLLFTTNNRENALLARWSQAWNADGSPTFYTTQTTCETGEYLFVSQHIEPYDITLVTYQNTLAIAWDLSSELPYMCAVVLLMGVLAGIIVIWANHSVNKPIRKIMESFEQLRLGELNVRIYHKKNDEFGYIYDSFNNTVIRIEELIDNISEQKALLRNAELMQLQSQINPHFLYNSFYNIKFLAHNEEYEQIETFVTALARYYRFINKETELDVALSSEVAHMDNYIEIQQMRFGDKITVIEDSLPQQAADFKVPKLILQPIIENAYNYGLKDKLEGGLLSIRYRMDGKYLLIEIEDNGGNLQPERLAQMQDQIQTYEGDAINHALTNIQRRLMLAYGKGSGLTLEIGTAGGLKVILRLDTTVRL